MQRTLLILQLLISLAVLAFIPDNAIKVAILLPIWWITFRGLRRNEIWAFVIANIIFSISDIGAIENGFFRFIQPDLWGMPWFEFFMWGFYFLHAHRILKLKSQPRLDLTTLFLSLCFAACFGLFQDKILILAITSSILVFTLWWFRSAQDLIMCLYMMAVGAIFEYVGLKFNIWDYPNASLSIVAPQFVIMWGGAGVFFHRMVSPFLHAKAKRSTRAHLQRMAVDRRGGAALEIPWKEAFEFFQRGESAMALTAALRIQSSAQQGLRILPREFHLFLSDCFLNCGQLRSAVESGRTALRLSETAMDRAEVHLKMCQLYRMMVLMRNARFELRKAAEELRLTFPENTGVSLIVALVSSIPGFIRYHRPVSAEGLDAEETRFLRLTVLFYEEIGLSAYYFRERLSIFQAGILSRAPAYQLGDSLQLLNWKGGYACVLTLLGLSRIADQLYRDAMSIADNLAKNTRDSERSDVDDSVGVQAQKKFLLWEALYFDYRGEPLKAGKSLASALYGEPRFTSGSDRVMAASTLCCHLFVRGKMQESIDAIDRGLQFQSSSTQELLNGRIYYDWYKIPALCFLGQWQIVESVLRQSRAIFSSMDEEKWRLAQYLGVNLIYQYLNPKLRNEVEIKNYFSRFSDLKLSPRNAYFEASFYWIGKAYLLLEICESKPEYVADFKKSLKELKQLPDHPNHEAHRQAILARWFHRQGQKQKAQECAEKARRMAFEQENAWVSAELLKLHEDSSQFVQFCQDHGWEGVRQ